MTTFPLTTSRKCRSLTNLNRTISELSNSTTQIIPISDTKYLVSGSIDDLRAAHEELMHVLRPPARSDVSRWLHDLMLTTARKSTSEADTRRMLGIYEDRLILRPAEAVQTALAPHEWSFWPTLKELEDKITRLSSPALALALAVKREVDSMTSPKKERKIVTAEEANKILRKAGFPPIERPPPIKPAGSVDHQNSFNLFKPIGEARLAELRKNNRLAAAARRDREEDEG